MRELEAMDHENLEEAHSMSPEAFVAACECVAERGGQMGWREPR
jgi:hypothetical protein